MNFRKNKYKNTGSSQISSSESQIESEEYRKISPKKYSIKMMNKSKENEDPKHSKPQLIRDIRQILNVYYNKQIKIFKNPL